MTPVSRYRFIPPLAHRGIIARAVAERISRSPYPLTFLASPGGFGKSTSMAQAFALTEAEGGSARWLNLYYQPLGADALDACLGQWLRPDAAEDARPAGLDRLLEDVENMCRRDQAVSLYLDEVAPENLDQLFRLAQVIAKHFGDRVRVVVASRETPPQLGGVLGGGGVMLTPADLAFTESEIGEMFGGELAEHDIADLIGKTGGWPALLASIRRSADQVRPRSDLLPGVLNGCEDLIADLVRDVMGVAPSSRDLEVLAAAFAFGSATAPIFEHDDFAAAGEIVTRLTRDGLMRMRADGSRLLYEPHAAVRFAVDRLGGRTPKKRIRDIHSFMAQSLLESGDWVGAVRHGLQSGDLDLLCGLIEAGGGWFLILQWGAPILEAVDAIPVERLAKRPAMLLAKVYGMMHAREVAPARRLLEEIAVSFEPDDFVDDEAFRTFQIGYALVDAILRSYEMRPIDFVLLDQLRDDAPAAMRTMADAVILNLKGGYQLREGHVSEAERIGRQATLKCRAANAAFVEAYVQLWLGYANSQSGKARDASKRFETVLSNAECFGADSSQMVAAKVFLADLEFERGNAERAYAIIESVFDRVEALDPWYEMLKPFYRIATSRACQEDGPEGAIDFLDRALHRTASCQVLPLSTYLGALRADMLLQSERDLQAIESSMSELDYVEPVDSAFLNIRVALKRKAFDEAEAALESLLAQAPVRHAPRWSITGLVLKAVCAAARGHSSDARRLADEAARLADRYDLHGHLQREFAASRWATGGALFPPGPGGAALPTPIAGGFPHLGSREREVLDMIVQGLSSKEIAWKMSISVGTVLGYRKSLYRKIGVNCRSAAISVARGALKS